MPFARSPSVHACERAHGELCGLAKSLALVSGISELRVDQCSSCAPGGPYLSSASRDTLPRVLPRSGGVDMAPSGTNNNEAVTVDREIASQLRLIWNSFKNQLFFFVSCGQLASDLQELQFASWVN